MRNHFSKFAFVYLWLAYILWVVLRTIFWNDDFTPLNWSVSPLALMFGVYQLSQAKMDLDLQRLREIDSST
jgi:hypothetical protein